MTRAVDAPGGIAAPQAGLTLIEMIVALAIGALVIAFLAQGTAMIRSFGRLGVAVSAQDETLAIRDHLRQVIGSALGGGTGPQRGGFAGVGDTAVFTAPGDRLLETGAPVRITLTALAENGRMSLVETRAPLGGETVDAKQRTRRLVGGASRIAFSYFGALSSDAPAGWASEWTDPEASPRLVRVDLAFPPGDRRRWPPFIVLMPTARGATGTVGPSASAAPVPGAAR